MTETHSSTSNTKSIRLNGEEAIEYAAAGHDTRLLKAATTDAPAVDDVDPDEAQEQVEEGVPAKLFSCEADPRIVALGRHLDDFDFTESRYGDNQYDAGRSTYLVLTDEEADDAAAEAVRNSLWAFNVDFLASHIPALRDDRAAKAWQKMVGELCEDANPLVEAMLGSSQRDFDHFVEDAIRADGRGHFLSQYDGNECEEVVGGVTYYIYQTN